MNVLITSVGRRSYIVKYFKDALGDGGKVFVCNSNPDSAAFLYADESVVSPLVYDKSYVGFLVDYCKAKGVDVILSLLDLELPVLSHNKDVFEKIGVRVLVSNENFIMICNDKWRTFEYLRDNGFNTPNTYKSYDEILHAIDTNCISFPIMVKPRFGCGSIGVTKAFSELELYSCYRRTKRVIDQSYLKYESKREKETVIFQEVIDGDEYGVDVVHDLNGVSKGIYVKKKIAMRAGETDVAISVYNPVIENDFHRLGTLTNHVANLDCDAIERDGTVYILEMNARFGGGYPFSHMAGIDLPRAIIDWCHGKDGYDSLGCFKVGIKGYKDIGVIKA